MKPIVITILFSFLLISCKKEIDTIKYGQDLCVECKMTIMDNKYGAALMSNKGKTYKFDSAECMAHYINEGKIPEAEVFVMKVSDHASPGTMIDAASAHFLHSQFLPSPMGAYLTALSSEESLKSYISRFNGEAWTWQDARNNLK
ncbi:MAG: hypothetical protein DWQ44_09370 [Bacteroidetes bacterium]|nr:MAG: hypothetical protein DWQ33_02410 [Bacteroidota bacterium]REK06493.1 MAG: hypothetical protein DWQ39_03160 [Bacteroidota bacterium]REK33259.1 MAG: hypothetical protein DWQ44_09370 [Bacteroidota bacterium]REK47096.1 MAG: hypothetical protein DWQ48_13705 [Bacteroidota bacterium]